MTATAAYTVTMPELRGDPNPSSLWSTYGGPAHISPRVGSNIDSGLANPPAASSHAGRSRTGQANMDHQAYPYTRYSHEEPESYSAHSHPGTSSHSGYPSNLKRSFAQSEAPPSTSQELLHEDGSRLTVNHDHKLLAFRRVQDKHTITDQHGRLQQLELSAQLHGMFFLSEMPSQAGEGGAQQPELTCYRRNLFQISGSLMTPRGPLSVVTETGESMPVTSMEVTVSAIESVDGNPVRLIVIPWKTPPPNSAEVNQQGDQEPQALPLIPFQDDGADANGEFAVYPIGWRRLQFRIATANNGRRKELQQHFVLHLKVFGTLSNNTKVVLTETTTAPIVVRGRSPRNFSTRKEIPLLGSSAGSRGQALVETGLGVVAGTVNSKQPVTKSRTGIDMQLPRSAFTFSPPKVSSTQVGPLRSSTYPAWQSPGHGSAASIASSPPFPTPTSIGADGYAKMPLSGTSHYSAEPQEMPLQTSLSSSVPLSMISEEQHQPPLRPPYGYVQSSAPRQMPSSASVSSRSDNVPRYVEDGRPTKAPRHAGHQSVHSTGALSNNDSHSVYRYGPYTGVGDVTHGSYTSDTSGPNATQTYSSSQAWTTAAGDHASTAAYASHDGRTYHPPYGQYKSETGGVQVKSEPDASHAAAYSGPTRGTFDGEMNHYSWGNT